MEGEQAEALTVRTFSRREGKKEKEEKGCEKHLTMRRRSCLLPSLLLLGVRMRATKEKLSSSLSHRGYCISGLTKAIMRMPDEKKRKQSPPFLPSRRQSFKRLAMLLQGLHLPRLARETTSLLIMTSEQNRTGRGRTELALISESQGATKTGGGGGG